MWRGWGRGGASQSAPCSPTPSPPCPPFRPSAPHPPPYPAGRFRGSPSGSADGGIRRGRWAAGGPRLRGRSAPYGDQDEVDLGEVRHADAACLLLIAGLPHAEVERGGHDVRGLITDAVPEDQ